MELLLLCIGVIFFVFNFRKANKRTITGNNYVRKQSRRSKKQRKPFKLNPVKRNLWSSYHLILEEKFPYYRDLETDDKKQFLLRLDRFIQTHRFVPAEMESVTHEMRIMISACAIQLTFGLSDFLADHIEGFKVYPTVYYSRLLDSHLRGHYSPKGVIFLSYKHFEQGYADSEDGRNLGLHEIAHALHHTYRKQVDYQLFFNDLVKDWFMVAREGGHIERPESVDGFLRKYAAANVHEFFAVCVENFFERPQELNDYLPMVYKHLCFLLNQNPLQLDFGIKPNSRPQILERPLFKEKASVVGATLAIAAGSILIGSAILINWEDMISFLFFGIPMIAIGLISRMTTNEVNFYDRFIRIESAIGKRVVETIDISSLLYIAYNKSDRSGKKSMRMSFVLYDNELKHTADVIAPTERFRRQVEHYCKERDIAFLD